MNHDEVVAGEQPVVADQAGRLQLAVDHFAKNHSGRVVRIAAIPVKIISARSSGECGLRLESLDVGLVNVDQPHFNVDSAGVYKPDVRVYTLVTDHYACAPADIVFVTSNGWDATGGAAFGYRVAWVNRLKNPAETFGPPPTWTIPDLASLPALIAAGVTPSGRSDSA